MYTSQLGQVDWAWFFPKGTQVIAFPSWQNPRLLVPARDGWRKGALYPASKWQARLYRRMMRTGAALRLYLPRRMNTHEDWALEDFLGDIFPNAMTSAVIVGTPGPIQKTTVEISDTQGKVLGYVKYGALPGALNRLHQEYHMLNALPDGLGPHALKVGPWQDGEALLLTPLEGREFPAKLPPSPELHAFCEKLVTGPAVPLSAHPWAMRYRTFPATEPWLEALAHRAWPTVLQHGDLAAWNLRVHNKDLQAFDWEYGSTDSLPYLDWAYFMLQTATLIYDWSPQKAFLYTTLHLTHHALQPLTKAEADALVRLSAFDAYQKTVADGYPPNFFIQPWRKAVWQCQPAAW